jgi:hypothetical protein
VERPVAEQAAEADEAGPAATSTSLSVRGPTRLRPSATTVENPPYQVSVPSPTPRSTTEAAADELLACAGAAAGNDTVQSAKVSGLSAVAATAVRNARRGATTSSAPSKPRRARQPIDSVLAPIATRIAALASPSHRRSGPPFRRPPTPARPTAA